MTKPLGPVDELRVPSKPTFLKVLLLLFHWQPCCLRLFLFLFNGVTLLRTRKSQEAVPVLEPLLPEPHATPAASSLGPAAAVDIRLRKKHIFF